MLCVISFTQLSYKNIVFQLPFWSFEIQAIYIYFLFLAVVVFFRRPWREALVGIFIVWVLHDAGIIADSFVGVWYSAAILFAIVILPIIDFFNPFENKGEF